MCTGITYIYRCKRRCGAILYKATDAAPGFTCRFALWHKNRGVCPTGVTWAYYDKIADESCVSCELFGPGGEVSRLTAETCPEAADEWPEDKEETMNADMMNADVFSFYTGPVKDGDKKDGDKKGDAEKKDVKMIEFKKGDAKKDNMKNVDGGAPVRGRHDEDEDFEDGGARLH